MANEFLVDIHNHLSQQIELSRNACERARSDNDESGFAFYDGKLDELLRLRAYISESFNLNTQRYY